VQKISLTRRYLQIHWIDGVTPLAAFGAQAWDSIHWSGTLRLLNSRDQITAASLANFP
jgi:hypothetical protein